MARLTMSYKEGQMNARLITLVKRKARAGFIQSLRNGPPKYKWTPEDLSKVTGLECEKLRSLFVDQRPDHRGDRDRMGFVIYHRNMDRFFYDPGV